MQAPMYLHRSCQAITCACMLVACMLLRPASSMHVLPARIMTFSSAVPAGEYGAGRQPAAGVQPARAAALWRWRLRLRRFHHERLAQLTVRDYQSLLPMRLSDVY
jgi:hypothetical protein